MGCLGSLRKSQLLTIRIFTEIMSNALILLNILINDIQNRAKLRILSNPSLEVYNPFKTRHLES